MDQWSDDILQLPHLCKKNLCLWTFKWDKGMDWEYDKKPRMGFTEESLHVIYTFSIHGLFSTTTGTYGRVLLLLQQRPPIQCFCTRGYLALYLLLSCTDVTLSYLHVFCDNTARIKLIFSYQQLHYLPDPSDIDMDILSSSMTLYYTWMVENFLCSNAPGGGFIVSYRMYGKQMGWPMGQMSACDNGYGQKGDKLRHSDDDVCGIFLVSWEPNHVVLLLKLLGTRIFPVNQKQSGCALFA